MSERRRTDLNFVTVKVIRSGVTGQPLVRLGIGGDAAHLSADDARALAIALADGARAIDVEPVLPFAAQWDGGVRRTFGEDR